jgi:hypothetical protein
MNWHVPGANNIDEFWCNLRMRIAAVDASLIKLSLAAFNWAPCSMSELIDRLFSTKASTMFLIRSERWKKLRNGWRLAGHCYSLCVAAYFTVTMKHTGS